MLESLTLRESEALRLLALGRANPDISREMVFGVSTIEHHVQRIVQELGVCDR